MRKCPACGEEKPPDLWQFKMRNGVRVPKCCKACNVARMLKWKLANKDKYRALQKAHQRRRARRAVLYRQTVELNYTASTTQLDAMRRAMAEHPPEVSGEAEMVAYFRGFVAGAKRSAEEGERFERLKDLVHRIAAETKMQRGMAYEDVLSAAYEGLLKFLRSPVKADSLEHERKMAAKAIRWHILDEKRSIGPFKKNGDRRYEVAEGGLPLAEGQPKPSETLQARAEASYALPEALESVDLPPRTKRILAALAEGCNFRESGEREGISESRVCQIVRDLRHEMPELEALLC